MAAGKPRPRANATLGDDPEARIAALVGAHGSALLRVARQHSFCSDDAQDAYQRALEIYLRRLASIERVTEGAYMKVVVRREAMAVRRGRAESVAGEEIDFDAQVAEQTRTPDERLASAERSARAAEALRHLKPDEASALLLKAEGHSYGEIGERFGWTYTKVNRAITEGRRRFLKTYDRLESGDGCDVYEPALSALAHGTATADALLDLRPHLRHCPACRAVVRELRGGRRRVAGWLPLPAILTRGRKPLDYATNIDEGAGLVTDPDRLVWPGRVSPLRLHLQNLLNRLQGSDVATTVQLTSASGGGRGAGIAALIGICLSSVGAGTYCVATLVLPEPQRVQRHADRASFEPEASPTPRPSTTPAPLLRPAAATPTATPTAMPAARAKRRAHRAEPKATPAATSGAEKSSTPVEQRHEDPPPAAPAVAGVQELGIERSATSATVRPAAAPATGGDEFSP